MLKIINFSTNFFLKIIENLLSRNYLSKIVSKINDNHTHDSSYYEPHDDFVDEFGTSHLSVLASNGDAVSITSSINYLLVYLINR